MHVFTQHTAFMLFMQLLLQSSSLQRNKVKVASVIHAILQVNHEIYRISDFYPPIMLPGSLIIATRPTVCILSAVRNQVCWVSEREKIIFVAQHLPTDLVACTALAWQMLILITTCTRHMARSGRWR